MKVAAHVRQMVQRETIGKRCDESPYLTSPTVSISYSGTLKSFIAGVRSSGIISRCKLEMTLFGHDKFHYGVFEAFINFCTSP